MAKASNQQSIKSVMCANKPKAAKMAGLTIQAVMQAFNSGLGIRKKTWQDGYFVYFHAGAVMDGNLNSPYRDDKAKTEEFTFGADPTIWEIVDRAYILKRGLISRVAGLNNLTDSKLIESTAKILKVTI